MNHAWSRRLATIPIVYVAFILMTILLPVVFIAGLAIDGFRWIASRTPAVTLRISAFGWMYLLGEVWAIAALAVTGLLPKGRSIAATYRLQSWWLNWNLTSVRLLFRLTFTVEGTAAIPPAPMLVLSRHASIIDSLLPGHYITDEYGIRLRYVLKKELLVDPALDIAGNRLPNVFVDRGGDTGRELAAIRDLVTTMPDDEGVLIYPEGTRYSEAKRIKFTRRVSDQGGAVGKIAAGYQRVLPPRTAGALEILGARSLDVVVLAHHGFDGFAEVRDIWSGGLVGSTISMRFHRVPRTAIPTDLSDRKTWLFEIWADVDRWVAHQTREGG